MAQLNHYRNLTPKNLILWPERKNYPENENRKQTSPSIIKETDRNFLIGRYDFLVLQIENQIREANELKKVETGIVAGIGDFIGEKTGTYETGKAVYSRMVTQAAERAKEIHTRLIAEFDGKDIPESEKDRIATLSARLERASQAKLEHVSWAKAAFNSAGIGDIRWDAGSLKNRAKIFAKTTISVVEGGYDAVSGIMEISGKALWICGAYVASSISEWKFDSSVGKLVVSDVERVFSLLTLENAKKAYALLPKALENFANATPDVQAEGFWKFFGNVLAGAGIGIKAVQAGKSILEWGMATVRAGTETTSRAARIVAKQAERASGVSERAIKVARKASAAGMATVALGTGEVAIAGTAIAGGTTVRYVGEMGVGGKVKASTAAESAIKDTMLAERMAKAEARSGVKPETVFANAALPDIERLGVAGKILGVELSIESEPGKTILHLHEKISRGVYQNGHAELRAMTEALDRLNISRENQRRLMENGILGKLVDTEQLYGHSNRIRTLREGETLPVGGSSMDVMDFHLQIDRSPDIGSIKNRMVNDSELHGRWEKIDPAFPSKIDSKLFSLLFLVENRIGPSLISTSEGLARRDAIYSAEKTVGLSRLMDEKALACAESSVEAKLFLDQTAKEIPELSGLKTELINGEVLWGKDHEFWEAHTYLFVAFQWKGYIFDPMNPIRQSNGVYLPKVSSVPSDFGRAISGNKTFVESTDLINGQKAYYWVGDFGNVDKNHFSTIFGEEYDGRARRAEARSGISSGKVLENARLDMDSRLKEIRKLIARELTPDQEQAIRGLHYYVNRGAHQNNQPELRVMAIRLKNVSFSDKEIGQMIRNALL